MAGTPEIAPEQAGRCSISGLVAAERTLSWKEFQALPRVRVTADFHCVTRFSTLDNGWEGFATARGAEAGPGRPGGLARDDPLLRRLHDQPAAGGLPLRACPLRRPPQRQAAAVDHGGPVRLVVPHLYAWKSAKWVNGVELLSEDQPRFLGGERLPHLRRPLERGALQLPGDPRGLPGAPAGQGAGDRAGGLICYRSPGTWITSEATIEATVSRQADHRRQPVIARLRLPGIEQDARQEAPRRSRRGGPSCPCAPPSGIRRRS